MPSAIVLIVDQLSAAMLGPYGNTTVETAQFNRLAGDSIVFDFAFSYSIDLSEACRAWWDLSAERNQRLIAPAHVGQDAAADESDGLIDELMRAGKNTVLITDDPVVSEMAATSFDRIVFVEQTEPQKPAAESADTQLATFFAQAAGWISQEMQPDTLCWVHSRGLSGAWDAPQHTRNQWSDEDDPDPPDYIRPPVNWIDPETAEPDELWGLQQVASAQISLIDQFLGVLLDLIDSTMSSNGDSTLLAVAAPRGCALGEHGLVGAGLQLYNESVHVPMFVRLPNLKPNESRSQTDEDGFRWRPQWRGRSGNLVPVDQLRTLVRHWMFGDLDRFETNLNAIFQVLPQPHSEMIFISSQEHDMLQTHAWKLIRSKMGGVQLFAKPDDRCDVNDVSDRCSEIVRELMLLLEMFGNRVESDPPLSITLTNELATRLE